MGLSLFNKRICNTYPGVIKTCDNVALTVTPKPMTDGVGNDVPIQIGTSTICYGGTQDFSGATVIGITAATAGLVSGGGTNSMVSAGSLGVLSTADGDCSVSIGSGAYNCCEKSINIGQGSTGLESCVIGIGFATSNTGANSIALGNSSAGTGNCSISIGEGAQSGAADAIGIGRSSNARCLNSISIGALSDVLSSNTTAVGVSTCIGPSSNSSSVFGQAATTLSDSSVAMGLATCVGTSASQSIAIGCGSFISTTTCAGGHLWSVAIGSAARVCDGGGANGSYRSIAIGQNATVTCNHGIALGFDSCVNDSYGIAVGVLANAANNAVSIGWSAGPTVSGCGTCSVYVGRDAGSNFACTVNIGPSAITNGNQAISIGHVSQNNSSGGISIGHNSVNTSGSKGITIGENACINNILATCAIAIGYNVLANRASTLTTCELETCVAGCGLIVKTPDGLNSYRIAVDNSGNITTALA